MEVNVEVHEEGQVMVGTLRLLQGRWECPDLEQQEHIAGEKKQKKGNVRLEIGCDSKILS